MGVLLPRTYANCAEGSGFLDDLVIIGYEAAIRDTLEMGGDVIVATSTETSAPDGYRTWFRDRTSRINYAL